jgi:RNA polymerase sigma factor (sigma-70 family)
MLAAAAKGSDHPRSAYARNALYLRHFDRISAMVARAKRIVAIMWDIDRSIEAEDVVQQTFLIFCDLLDTWNGNSQEETFLSYIARLLPSHATHFVRDTLHYRARTRVLRQQPLESTIGNEAEFEDMLVAQLQSNISWADQTRDLPEQSNRWVTLRYNLGLTTVQIALLSGVSPRTVDRHLKAALTQMRNDLQSIWENCA